MQANGQAPVGYAYDAASRLTGIVQGPQTVTLTYDDANRRATLTLPNGGTTSYTYDAASRLIAQTYTGPHGLLGDLTYTYDPNGNHIATAGSWARTLLPAPVLSSSYDPANEQLVFGDLTQTFDPNGNLVAQTDPSGTTTYTWDARNRLVAITAPTISASFSYDPLGRRVSKTINGVTTTFHYDGLDIIRENGSGGEAAYLRTLAIDEALARTETASTFGYLADTLGSTIALADASGSPVINYAYAPFGETSVSSLPSPNPFQFTGREKDGIGLYYYRARYYDPMRGRFISEDPIGFLGGDTNVYRYVRGGPVSRRDPFGLADCPPTKRCRGFARVLQGNPDTIGQPGGWSGPSAGDINVAAGSAAVVPSQWGGKGSLRPNIGNVSGAFNGIPLFSGITDVVGGKSPLPGMTAGNALMKLYPGRLIIELPSGPQDMGTIPIELTIPAEMPCPAGTTPVE